MARQRRINSAPGTNAWMWEVTDVLNQLPAFSVFSGNPNTSGVTAGAATLGFNEGSGATQRLWINESGTTNSWSWLSWV